MFLSSLAAMDAVSKTPGSGGGGGGNRYQNTGKKNNNRKNKGGLYKNKEGDVSTPKKGRVSLLWGTTFCQVLP